MFTTRSSSNRPFLRFISLLITYYLFATSLGHPAPLDSAETLTTTPKSVTKRACPPAIAIEGILAAKGIGENTVFYTGKSTSVQAVNFAQSLDPPGKSWADLIDVTNTESFLDECLVDVPSGSTVGQEQEKMVPRIGASMAALSTGTAYVLLKPDEDIRGGTIWSQYEFPVLMARSRGVKKIVRVDPENWHNRDTVWKKGEAPIVPIPANFGTIVS